MWDEHGCCQKFFTEGVWQRYFRVSSGSRSGGQADPEPGAVASREAERGYVKGEIMSAFDAARAVQRQELDCLVDDDDDGAREPSVSPWLEVTRWMRYVKQHNCTELSELAFPPDREREPVPLAIADSLDRVVERAYESICQDKINVFD
ncbi:Hypothetical protein D9617_64g101320 [Elsinoe fawcettii]|nr:Hypothetical protein D9617_64g101320 [Elsinoe fawcettii]